MITNITVKAAAKKFAGSAPTFMVSDAEDAVKAFKTGINWFREAIWHSDDEIPRKYGFIVINPQERDAEIRHTRPYLGRSHTNKEDAWKNLRSYIDDRFKWCYLADILPQKREEVSMADKIRKIIYFGTDGCLGHYPKGVNCELTAEEYDELKRVDRVNVEEQLERDDGWFEYRTHCGTYTCFGVPYSLDDKRPGSKSIVMMEDSNIFDVILAVKSIPFLYDKFKELNERYDLDIDFLRPINYGDD